FDLRHCSRAGARFDYEKGRWFNHEYLMKMDDSQLAALFRPVLERNGINPADFTDEYIARAVGMVKSRIHFVDELWAQGGFFFKAPETYSPKDVKKRWNEQMPEILTELIGVIEGIDDMSSQNAEHIVLDWIASKGYHLGNVMNAFRLAVVGECRGPHMFDITELIPKEEVIARLRKAINDITPA
ncbi:MAG: glutamate--tRNA ligase, partial [Muribaculum sp.]|nr:glutamate--tRNA ligase [Muribaculum sp.]